MLIFAHRGLWKSAAEQNAMVAFTAAFELGFGIETDLREYKGKLILAHDIANGNELDFESFLRLMDGRNLPLALNIKSDGLSWLIKKMLLKYNHSNYFAFDMSIPELVVYLNSKINAFTGLSDIVTQPPLLKQCEGVWLDCFEAVWYRPETIDKLVASGKKVCIVSAELHKRSCETQWQLIQQCKYLKTDNIMLCTDFPQKAKAYFHG